MSNWQIDESSCCVIIDGKPVSLRPQSWKLLQKLCEAKRRNGVGILTFENIGEILWPGELWDDARKESVKKVVKNIRGVIGSESIANKPGYGYYLKDDVPKPDTPGMDYSAYFEQLWSSHCKGERGGQDNTGNARELIDYFEIPVISSVSGETNPVSPFSGMQYRKYLTAGSGFGKSTLLHMMVLCSIARCLYACGSSALSENSGSKVSEYDEIRRSLFGDEPDHPVPVFIHSRKANTASFGSLTELADASGTAFFHELLENAHRRGNLLFLIDSLDEVESDKRTCYLNAVGELIENYPKAAVVLTSRFPVKKSFLPDFEKLQIRALKPESIKKIADILFPGQADEQLTRMKNNRYLYALAQNPFMLMIILEEYEIRELHRLLESIVHAIIDKRWDINHYGITTDDMKLLLGFLACKFAFEFEAEGRPSADLSEIRQCFMKTADSCKLYEVPFDVPAGNIEYFLKTLSSQSGILNIQYEHRLEKFVFQDRLIMCWLAANYLTQFLNQSETIHDRGGDSELWQNICRIDWFIRSFTSADRSLSLSAITVLVLALVMQRNGQLLQKSLLTYLVCRDAASADPTERESIACGYHDLLENAFGENDILNGSNAPCTEIVRRMLAANSN